MANMNQSFEGKILQRGLRGARLDYDEEGGMRFVCSTERIARDGHVISADAWRLDDFKANPVMLFGHKDDELPIGKWSNLEIEELPEGDRGLVGTAHFASEEYDFAATVEKLYRCGALNAVSVRWSPNMWEPLEDDSDAVRFTDVDLLEISAVPVPADPDALVIATQRGILTPDAAERFAHRVGMTPKIMILGTENRTMDSENATGGDIVADDYTLEENAETPEIETSVDSRAISDDERKQVRGVVLDQLQALADAIKGDEIAAITEALPDLKDAVDGLQAVAGAVDAMYSDDDEEEVAEDEESAEEIEADSGDDVEIDLDASADDEPIRAGKKISAKRATRIAEARDGLKTAIKVLDEILSENDEGREAPEAEARSAEAPAEAVVEEVDGGDDYLREILGDLEEIRSLNK